MLRYRLRTLLILLALLPPLFALGYRKWQDYIWAAHYAAKLQRDNALVEWRIAFTHYVNRKSAESAAEEREAQMRYFAARKQVEATVKAIRARYPTDEALSRAVQSRAKR